MKKSVGLIFAISSLITFSEQVHAQSDIANLFKGGVEDLNTLVNGYMKPAGQGFASGLGSNWYNTAETHKVLGFDLTVGVNGAFTPSADQSFNISSLNQIVAPNGETKMPTFAGSGDGIRLQSKAQINGKPIFDFTTPSGLSKITPSPTLQLGVGLPFGSELAFRIIPTVNADGFEANMIGFGLKHDIKQWIPIVKLLPFDASAFVGYTKFKLNYGFAETDRITPGKLFSEGVQYEYENPSYNDYNVDYSGQGFKIDASALTANLLVSKKLAFFTPYLGVGVTSTKFNLNFAGNYPVASDVNTTNGKVKVRILEDPVKASYSEVMPGATVGFRIKMLYVLALNAQYTIQKYPTASVGFGINFR
jgi:hypothetical protein